jgi:hypothetical protein
LRKPVLSKPPLEITYDRHGHLMPGNGEEAAGLLDAHLTRATGAAG